MTFAVEMCTGAIVYIQSFMKISWAIQKYKLSVKSNNYVYLQATADRRNKYG
jgi:hypothetical protein